MDWIGMILTLIGVYLSGKKHIACWPVHIASNTAWIVHWLHNANSLASVEWAAVLLSAILFGLNILGWKHWIASPLPDVCAQTKPE